MEVYAASGAEAEHDAFVVKVEVGEDLELLVTNAFQIGRYVGSVPAASVVTVVAVGAWS